MLSVPQFSTPDLCAASYLRWDNPKRFSTIRRPLGATAEVTPHYTVVSWLDTGVRGDKYLVTHRHGMVNSRSAWCVLVGTRQKVRHLGLLLNSFGVQPTTLVTGFISALLI